MHRWIDSVWVSASVDQTFQSLSWQAKHTTQLGKTVHVSRRIETKPPE